tara:strand:+ start:33 stop:470 length:438 start_codon:yes stop_codon:yes gene_type:complete
MISREAIKTGFQQILSIDEPPHRISLAFAVGIFIAFSPTFGLHTVSAVAAAWLFKLNLTVIIAGTLVNNPWTIVFVYGSSICFGSFVLQNGTSCLLEGVGKDELLTYLKAMPMPFLTGTIILGIIVAIISYFVLYQVLVRYRGAQ